MVLNIFKITINIKHLTGLSVNKIINYFSYRSDYIPVKKQLKGNRIYLTLSLGHRPLGLQGLGIGVAHSFDCRNLFISERIRKGGLIS